MTGNLFGVENSEGKRRGMAWARRNCEARGLGSEE